MLNHIKGRSYDFIVRGDGELVHGTPIILHMSKIPGVCQIQLVQESQREYHLRVVAEPAANLHQIRALTPGVLEMLLGKGIRCDLEFVEFIPAEPNGKVNPIISKCLVSKS